MKPPALLASVLLAALLSSAASAAASFKLVLHAQEPRIEGGGVIKTEVVKSWPMNAKGIEFSRQAGKFSTLLTAGLDIAERQIGARTAKSATFRNVGGHWIARQQNGWTLDRAATKANILKAALAGQDSAEAVYTVTAPQRSVQLLAERGVLSHVSSGSSSYRGSPGFRETNILVGAQKLDNFFVAPGHTFDFAREVGDISASTGFVKGYVISGGTLEKEDGGGLCQVSTTIFRAMYRAGLPIVERHEHSHRVEYYDPVGFEATVYAPQKNLRMKNDTAAYLFVQASWDRHAQTLRFDLFGAAPTRTVRIAKPVVTAFRPPAQPSYTPDDRVRAGGGGSSTCRCRA
ncbi:VanW family protein [Deinococcus sp. KNUC1210]|uniref:VanW family protein n=1 Tax=Deinococcus sp. KNUC1210 TaxID=2917691 RepID=UPI001EF138BE|nr:VanW family protein [Deinococcus sp. KNUC1210]ULH14628.1 VanW family protein [Deinococcus sp. KNUC1210]